MSYAKQIRDFFTYLASGSRVALTGTNTYVGTLSPVIAAYADGQAVNFKVANANTGAATINLNGLGAKSVTLNGAALVGGELIAGQYINAVYDSVSGSFQLQGASSVSANKLNAGANSGLAGIGSGITLLMPDGTIFRDVNMSYDPNTRTAYIGTSTTPGNLSIYSNTFLLQVQANIASGSAKVVFNDNQAKAFVFASTDGKEYFAFRSTDGDEAVILFQKYVFDMGIFAPLNSYQGQITDAATTNKVYFADSSGNTIQIPFAVDNVNIRVSGSFMAHNNSGTVGSTVMSGTFSTTLKRISGVISVVATKITIEADSATYTPSVGAESLDNNTIQIFAQCTSATHIDWKIGKAEVYKF